MMPSAHPAAVGVDVLAEQSHFFLTPCPARSATSVSTSSKGGTLSSPRV